MMNIWATEGHKVIVTEETAYCGYNSDKELVKEHLEIGKEYTVNYTLVEGWSTEVELKEVPDVLFNSVNFDDAEELTEEQEAQHPQYSDYN